MTSAKNASSEIQAVVAAMNMNVWVSKDSDHWIAQGLDMDYISQGDTLEECKQSFEDGLAATIHEYLKIDELQKLFTPQKHAWQEFVNSSSSGPSLKMEYSQISFHRIPIPLKIAYLKAA